MRQDAVLDSGTCMYLGDKGWEGVSHAHGLDSRLTV